MKRSHSTVFFVTAAAWCALASGSAFAQVTAPVESAQIARVSQTPVGTASAPAASNSAQRLEPAMAGAGRRDVVVERTVASTVRLY